MDRNQVLIMKVAELFLLAEKKPLLLVVLLTVILLTSTGCSYLQVDGDHNTVTTTERVDAETKIKTKIKK
jgi:hypothetical protein